MNIRFQDVVALVAALAWPVVAVIALVALRQQWPQLLARLTKASMASFSIELATVPQFAPTWATPNLADIRQPNPTDAFASAGIELINQMKDDTASDYAVIDLGGGDQWLTSRLFIFAIMLHRMRGLKCFVFLETAGVERRFVGLASPGEVHWALARRYPWLENAFANAYAPSSGIGPLQVTSAHGALEPNMATRIVAAYLHAVQQDASPASDVDEWINLHMGANPTARWEHGKWLDAERLRRVLGGDLNNAWAPYAPDLPATEQANMVLRRKGAFVALTEEGKVFTRLVDRKALMEQAVAKLAAPTGQGTAPGAPTLPNPLKG